MAFHDMQYIMTGDWGDRARPRLRPLALKLLFEETERPAALHESHLSLNVNTPSQSSGGGASRKDLHLDS